MIGVRRAFALLVLGFYVSLFSLQGFLGPEEFVALFLGLAICYGLAFVAVAAEWFWGRWFAIGVGNFGSLWLFLVLQLGPEPILLFVGLTHLAVALLLSGEGMAARYEYSEITSERWNFQEESLILMRRAVVAAGSTIPILIFYALGPRPEALAWGVLALAGLGFCGLFSGRTWGVLALGAAGLVAMVQFFVAPVSSMIVLGPHLAVAGTIFHLAAAILLLLVPVMFLRPMFRFVCKEGPRGPSPVPAKP